MFLLQELYVRRGLPPKYDLVHDPTFMYRVTIGEFEATGCGQSKKKAKHSAIQALQKILIGAQNSAKAIPFIPDLATGILLPYDDGINGNPVGCSRRCACHAGDLLLLMIFIMRRGCLMRGAFFFTIHCILASLRSCLRGN